MIRLGGLVALLLSLAIGAYLLLGMKRFSMKGIARVHDSATPSDRAILPPSRGPWILLSVWSEPVPEGLTREGRTDLMDRTGVAVWTLEYDQTNALNRMELRVAIPEEAGPAIRPNEPVRFIHRSWPWPFHRVGRRLGYVDAGSGSRLWLDRPAPFVLSGLALAGAPLVLWAVVAVLCWAAAPRRPRA